MIRVDYAGPGGTCEGMRMLGLEPVGIEWDAAACATRAAAGHLTIRADLATYRPHHPSGWIEGYWASPPCQTFSMAGKGSGRELIDELGQAILAEDWEAAERFDHKTRHVLDAARVACTVGAEWIGMEQVPGVLPLWRALSMVLRRRGYSTWCGVLNAADYGVPQTRRRAILMASRSTCISPPPPSHSDGFGLFGEEPWVTISESLGMGDLEGRWVLRNGAQERSTVRGLDEPAPTMLASADNGDTQILGPAGERYRLTVADVGRLQSFPADYPWQGTRSKQFEQAGNAVPPLLAAHVVGALARIPVPVLTSEGSTDK